MLQTHFLDRRTRHVNDEVRAESSFEGIKQKRSWEHKPGTYQTVFEEPLQEISELKYIRTSSVTDDDVMAKTIQAARNDWAFKEICNNTKTDLQAFNSAIRSSYLEIYPAISTRAH